MGMRKLTDQWRLKQKRNQNYRMPYAILYLRRRHDNIRSMFIPIVMSNRSIFALLPSPKG